MKRKKNSGGYELHLVWLLVTVVVTGVVTTMAVAGRDSFADNLLGHVRVTGGHVEVRFATRGADKKDGYNTYMQRKRSIVGSNGFGLQPFLLGGMAGLLCVVAWAVHASKSRQRV